MKDKTFLAIHKTWKYEFTISVIDWEKKMICSYPAKVKNTHTWDLIDGVGVINHREGTVTLSRCPFDLVDIEENPHA